jgi:hypothetical protein
MPNARHHDDLAHVPEVGVERSEGRPLPVDPEHGSGRRVAVARQKQCGLLDHRPVEERRVLPALVDGGIPIVGGLDARPRELPDIVGPNLTRILKESYRRALGGKE